jgi:hypothetical protein
MQVITGGRRLLLLKFVNVSFEYIFKHVVVIPQQRPQIYSFFFSTVLVLDFLCFLHIFSNTCI